MVVAKKEINILFTSAGRRVELLRAFRNAYLHLDISGNIVAVDINPLAPALQIADQIYIVPPITSSKYIPTLRDICQSSCINLVFPLLDPDISKLARYRQELEATNARVVVLSKNSATITSNKWLTYRFFRRLKIPTPCSWLLDEVRDANFKYPVFIKPRFGSASKQTFKVHNERELAFFLDNVSNPIVQEYLSGPEITNDITCDYDGNILSVVSRQRIEVRCGEVAKGITIYNPLIIDSCVKIAEELEAIGPITIQCILKDGVPYFTEINARFGGGLPLGIAAGVDSPRWLLAKAVGLEVEIPPLGNYQVGMSMTRFDNSFFLSKEDVEKLESYRF